MRSALVVAELALALIVLVGAGLLARSFGRLLAWDPGFDRTGVVTSFMLPPASSGGTVQKIALMEHVRDEVATIPGIRGAALTSGGPLFNGDGTEPMQIEGRPALSPRDLPPVEWFDISRRYFETLGVRVVRGRSFDEKDTGTSMPVAVVNETLVRRFFAGENPIGQRVTALEHPAQIVGVVADMQPFRPDEPPAPQIYWPIEQYRRTAATLLFRVAPGMTGMEKTVRARVASVNAGIQLAPFITLDDLMADNLVTPRFNMLLVASFAVVALLLAAVGVFGVIACSVAGRTREIGVQIALGATPRHVVSAILKQGLRLTAIGVALGVFGALAVGRLLSSLLYGLPTTDPLTLLSAIAVFVPVAFGASWLPARRATLIDPLAALRVQ